VHVVIVGRLPDTARQLVVGLFSPGHTVAFVEPAALAARVAEAEVLIPEHGVVDAATLERAGRLRLVQTGAGFDNVAIGECTRRGIWVASARGVSAAAVAEHVLGLILCWCRNLVALDRVMKAGGYSAEYTGAELSDRVLGIVGLGSIGRRVAALARAFGMRVLGSTAHPERVDADVEPVGLEQLLRTADVVSLHTPLTEVTRHLIGRRELGLMRPEAFLVNTSRGGVVDEAALVEALESRRIGGAGLDVFEVEPLPVDSPLRRLPNVILTPHTAGMPDGLRYCRRRYEFFRENATLVSLGREPRNALNRPRPLKLA
jgi:phosphoglycerate dehydrogenase-like enzyme